jgi:hypothetical protein
MAAPDPTEPSEAIGTKVRSGAEPEAPDLKRELPLSADSGRWRDRWPAAVGDPQRTLTAADGDDP